MPAANACFCNDDRVEGTKNPVAERLPDLQKIAEILGSKFGGGVDAYVIAAPVLNGPFSVYKDFIPTGSQNLIAQLDSQLPSQLSRSY